MALRSGFGLAVLLSSLLLPVYDSVGYEATTVSDGGTIKGKVIYTAAPPAPRKIVHTKDHEVCGSGVREVDQITIASDKVVQDAIVIWSTSRPPLPHTSWSLVWTILRGAGGAAV